jgi:hypothetical protein
VNDTPDLGSPPAYVAPTNERENTTAGASLRSSCSSNGSGRANTSEAKGHGPTLLAEQRGLVTDREDVHERRSGRRWRVDLPSGCRFVPSSENQGSQIRWISGLPRRRWFRRLSVSVRTVRWRVRIHDHPSYQQKTGRSLNSKRIAISQDVSRRASGGVQPGRHVLARTPRSARMDATRPHAHQMT